MEHKSPLNEAHFNARQAERLLKKGKFQEAISQQDKIVALLELAKADSTDNKVTESLDLQIEHHLKQKLIITQKQVRCQRFSKDLKNLQQKMAKANVEEAGLQDSIYRTFEETESLLAHLKEASPCSPTTGAKMPKDDKIIIEELSTANLHLRDMVQAMFHELETYKRENTQLKARVHELELERVVGVRGDHPHTAPHLGLTPEGPRHDLLADSGHLPPLAPLELPEFDYGKSSDDPS